MAVGVDNVGMVQPGTEVGLHHLLSLIYAGNVLAAGLDDLQNSSGVVAAR